MSDKKKNNNNASFDALKDKAKIDSVLNQKLDSLNSQLDSQIDHFEYQEESISSDDNRESESSSLNQTEELPENVSQKTYDTVAVGKQKNSDQIAKIPDGATPVLVQTFDVKPNVGIVNKKERIEYQILNDINQDETVTVEAIEKEANLPAYNQVVNFDPGQSVITESDSDSLVENNSEQDKKYNTITGKKPELNYSDANQSESELWKYDPEAKITGNDEVKKIEKKQEAKETKAPIETEKQLVKKSERQWKKAGQTDKKPSIKLSTIGSIIGGLVAIGLILFGISYLGSQNNNNDQAKTISMSVSPTRQLIIEKALNQKPAYVTDDMADQIKKVSRAIDSVELTTQLTGNISNADANQPLANALTIYQGDANITAGQAPLATNNVLLSEKTAKSIAGDQYLNLLGQTVDIRVDIPLKNGDYQSVQGQLIVTGFTDGSYDQAPEATVELLYKGANVPEIKPNRIVINLNDSNKANQVYGLVEKVGSYKMNNIILNN